MRALFICLIYSFSAYAVRNGVPVEQGRNQNDQFVYIRSPGPCTGVRISRTTVLSAAHCFNPAPGDRTFNVQYIDGNSMRTQRIQYRKVSKRSSTLSREMAAFEINPRSESEEFTPIQVYYEDYSNLTNFQVYGFGVNEENPRRGSEGTLRSGRVFLEERYQFENGDTNIIVGPRPISDGLIECENSLSMPLDGNEPVRDALEVTMPSGSNQMPCQGDSGGPLLGTNADGELVLVGILSTVGAYIDEAPGFADMPSYEQCSYVSFASYLTVSENREFIESNLTR